MLKKITNFFLGKKVNGARIIPLSAKITFFFGIILLVSNFSTNFINLSLTTNLLEKYLKTILLKDLKEIVQIVNNQYELYTYTENIDETKESLNKIIENAYPSDLSLIFGIDRDQKLFFSTDENLSINQEFLDSLGYSDFSTNNIDELSFTFSNKEYIGVYRYYNKFNFYLIRAEEKVFYEKEVNFVNFIVSIIIITITLICSLLGFYFINNTTKHLNLITEKLIEMQEKKSLSLIDLKNASNDQVTYLGVVLNSLSYTMQNLLGIFRKFVSDDLVQKAYRERAVQLEGEKKELAILFTDIKKFTFITETLGNDVINLLNLFYDKAISSILKEDGIIGSIIGDALLAVYGTFHNEEEIKNKSYQAILSAFKIIDNTNELRSLMIKRKEEYIGGNQQSWTELDEKIFNAVMLDVGVGIDGGEVFYGNIGSNRQMTNTVIGDNVNSASRLEGLTRKYSVSIICSEYIKKDVEKIINNSITFIEIDKVLVKGKTKGKVIYYPVLEKNISQTLAEDFSTYKEGLELYYKGEWKKANKLFKKVKEFKAGEIMADRTKGLPPKDWTGSWVMTEK